MNCPLWRISDNGTERWPDEDVSGIRRQAGDESIGSHLEGDKQGDQMDSSGGLFRGGTPDHPEDAGRLPGTGGWRVARPTPGAAVTPGGAV